MFTVICLINLNLYKIIYKNIKISYNQNKKWKKIKKKDQKGHQCMQIRRKKKKLRNK
jgi:hypothetical protein